MSMARKGAKNISVLRPGHGVALLKWGKESDNASINFLNCPKAGRISIYFADTHPWCSHNCIDEALMIRHVGLLQAGKHDGQCIN